MEEEVMIEDSGNFIEEGTPEYEMLKVAQQVQVRDGDDLITINVEDGEDEEDEEYVDEETPESDEVVSEGEEELPALQEEAPLVDTAKLLDENREGFEEMVTQAVEAGKVTVEDIELMMDEYEQKGTLAEETLAKLEEAGYPRKFIQSYIDAQEAVAQRYVNEIHNYVGGKDNFDRYVQYLESTSTETFELLQEAITDGNIKSVKGILGLARDSMVSKFGKTQQRTVTKQARVAKSPVIEAFNSKQEMIAAMSDPRYNRDPVYTQQVAQKVYNSNF